MADNTSNSRNDGTSRTPGRLAIDAADLLISDSDAWDYWPVTKSAESCGRTRDLGINTRTGALWHIPVSCRTYGHQPCAEKLVKGYLRTIAANLDGRPPGFMIVMDEDDYEPGRLKHRLSDFRAKRLDDQFDFYRTVHRVGDKISIVSTAELTGRLSPTSMEPVDDLLAAAAEALRLPGIVRFGGTRWRVKPKKKGGSESHSFGSMHEDEKEAFLEQVSDEVFKCHGVRVDPSDPMAYPRKITMEQYIACADAVIARG